MELKHHPAKVGRGDIVRLPPASILIDATHNIRDMQSERTRAHIDELKIAIKAWGGIKDPVEVRMVGDDAYVTDGECRLTAVLELIRDEGFACEGITCIKEASGTDEKERLLNFGVSGTKERYNELELAEWCRRCDRAGIPHDRIAAAAGWKSTASVKRHLELNAILPEPVKEQVRNGDVSATLALKITKEVRDAKTDPEFAAELIRANKEENARIKGKRTRVTQTTINRDRQRAAKPKSEEQQDAGPTTTPATGPEHAVRTPSILADPVSESLPETPEHRVTAHDGPEIGLVADLALAPPQATHFPSIHGSVAILVEAIRPFAKIVDDIDPDCANDTVIFISDHVGNIDAGQLRGAWKALQAVTGGVDG